MQQSLPAGDSTQERRFRIRFGWKLSGMDLESLVRWDDDIRRSRSHSPARSPRARRVRLRALRGAYLDTLTTACQRLGVSPPPHGDRAPQAEIYRAEAALRQRGLDVRETASP
jgi:hypothetical protein